MCTLPGTPVIRYGDEIGMGDDLALPERNCARTPMQWSTEPHGGFTESDKPVLAGDQRRRRTAIEHVNVAEQRRDPDSMLNWMERIIRMRKEVPEIGWGDFAISTRATPRCWSMRYDWRNNAVLFVHNLGATPREVAFASGVAGDARQPAGQFAVARITAEPEANGRHSMLLEPYGYRWFRVGGLDYLLRRSDV